MENKDAKNAEPGNIKGFRLNAKKVFLTYPKCKLTKEELLDKLPNKESIEQYYIARELHEDGEPHLHAILVYNYKLNIKSEKHFDIGDYHPNIQSVKKLDNAISYVCKDGDFIMNYKLDMTKPDNYCKRKKDFIAWGHDMEMNNYKEISYPIQFMGSNIEKPDPSIKKRNLWFVGKPDLGKTYMIEKAFAGLRVYKRGLNKYPFEQYDNEDIIIYDDFLPTFTEIANICNTYYTRTQVYGDVRYNSKYWKHGHTRTIIVINNTAPRYGELQDAVESRFEIIPLDPPKLVRSD